MPRPYFYKLMLSSTIQAKQLRIPENFVRKIRGELAAVATLAVPDGHVWRVGLKRADNKFWFQEGWQEFVEHYSIRVGYFLVFRYEGNSAFIVYIFNLSTSEINYQSSNLSSTQGTKYINQNVLFDEIDDDESAEMLGSFPYLTSDPLRNKLFVEGADQLTSARVNNPPPLQNLFNGSKMNSINWSNEKNLQTPKGTTNLPTDFQSTRAIGVQSGATELNKSVDEVKLQVPDTEQKTKKRGRKKKRTDSNEQESTPNDEEMRFRFYESASARKRTVTAEERERTINAAKTFEPVNPFCRVVLRPSYLYRGCIMYLPSCFAEKNLSGVSGFIKLQISDGREWPVRCLNKGGKTKFSQGWYEFCLENNLGEGDVCVFELIRANEIVLKVTMFRVMIEDASLVNPISLQSFSQSKLIRN